MEYTDGTVKFKVSRLGVVSDALKSELNDKQDKLIFDSTPISGSVNPVTSDGIKKAIDAKQDVLTLDPKPIVGSTNPVTSDGIAVALAGVQSGVVDGDVSNPDAWWVKLGGTIPLIIQGGRHTTGSAAFNLPIAYPHKILATVAIGENARLTEFVKLIHYDRTSIALQSISREGNDTGARPIQWISVGY